MKENCKQLSKYVVGNETDPGFLKLLGAELVSGLISLQCFKAMCISLLLFIIVSIPDQSMYPLLMGLQSGLIESRDHLTSRFLRKAFPACAMAYTFNPSILASSLTAFTDTQSDQVDLPAHGHRETTSTSAHHPLPAAVRGARLLRSQLSLWVALPFLPRFPRQLALPQMSPKLRPVSLHG